MSFSVSSPFTTQLANKSDTGELTDARLGRLGGLELVYATRLF